MLSGVVAVDVVVAGPSPLTPVGVTVKFHDVFGDNGPINDVGLGDTAVTAAAFPLVGVATIVYLVTSVVVAGTVHCTVALSRPGVATIPDTGPGAPAAAHKCRALPPKRERSGGEHRYPSPLMQPIVGPPAPEPEP